MKSSSSTSFSSLDPDINTTTMKKMIYSLLPWFLALSAILLLATSLSSNPSPISLYKVLDPIPSLADNNSISTTTAPPPSSSSSHQLSTKSEESINQAPPISIAILDEVKDELPKSPPMPQNQPATNHNSISTTTAPPPSSSSSDQLSTKIEESINQAPPISFAILDEVKDELPKSPPPMPQNQPTTNDTTKGCNLYEGKWVYEPREPQYTSTTCRSLPPIRNCKMYGKNQDHLNWRWKPDGCELPMFDARAFLTIARGKKLAFVGDSLARNHMESILCALSQGDNPVDTYKDELDKCRTWFFPSYNFTLMVIWSEFLVDKSPRMVNGTASGSNVYIDKIDEKWAKLLPELNYLVISSTNWFFRKNLIFEDGKLLGCVSCAGEANMKHFDVEFAVRRVFRTALQYISQCDKCEGLVTVMRTYSQGHFEHGYWFNGGYCNRTQPFSLGQLDPNEQGWRLRRIQLEEFEMVRGGEVGGKVRFETMDVTMAMMMRVDGHPGPHWRYGKGGNDCLHWCMPGPIDTWNEMLFEIIKKVSVP